jgi:hypothetical protein
MISSDSLPATPSERALFSELTRLLQEMQTAPFAQLEAAIEDRFRSFLRLSGTDPEQGGALEITLTWGLPEGPDSWAYYAASYRTVDAAGVSGAPGSGDDDGAADNVVPFPDLERLRALAGVA